MEINIEEYKQNGYTRIDEFLKGQWVDSLNLIIDKLVENPPENHKETFFDESKTGKIKQIQYLNTYDKVFQDIFSKVKTMAESVFKRRVEPINMQLFEKHPQISKPTRAHQDNAYFKYGPADAMTFWLALDDIDEENGCIYYAPKTHLTPTRKHSRYNQFTTFRTRSGVPGLSLCLHEHPEETDIPMIVKKGDMLLHSCNLVHRAGANTSLNRRRRAIGMAFVPVDCSIDNRLNGYHLEQLKEDIELQKIKDPILYKELKEKFHELYENKN